MRPWFALSLLGLSMLGSGCALIEDGHHNLAVSVSRCLEMRRECQRNRRWAEAAWSEICAAEEATAHSSDYAAGFKDGYAEYLLRGGEGEPPLVAPCKYHDLRYQTPQGYQAIQDWFSGYRHGAAVARQSGVRRWITGPSALATDRHDAPPPPLSPDQAARFGLPTGTENAPPPDSEIIPLPPPRVVPANAPDASKDPMRPAPNPSGSESALPPRNQAGPISGQLGQPQGEQPSSTGPRPAPAQFGPWPGR